jgi:nucleotidyltransferase substrate binding protein (TIGR01987 family)
MLIPTVENVRVIASARQRLRKGWRRCKAGNLPSSEKNFSLYYSNNVLQQWSNGQPYNMILELESLVAALSALEKSILTWNKLSQAPGLTVDDLQTIKSGVIQNFEVAYEQCWKFMKRWLELNVSPDVADGVPRRELFRLSVENRLIDDIDLWMEFHKARNLTAHTYHAGNAEQAFQAAVMLPEQGARLLERLRARNA